MSAETTGKKAGIKMPDPLVLLAIFIIVAAVASYIVPAGQYDRVLDEATGRNIVDPLSYHAVDSNPTSFMDLLLAVPKGMQGAAYIIFFMFFIGGAVKIIQSTGAIDVGMANICKKMSGKELLLIPVIMIICSLGGTFIGNAEEFLAFIPIMVPICIALGFDSITGTAILLVGGGAGFAGAMTNAFTVGVAQGISGLPPFSGIGLRAWAYVALTLTSVIYVMLYAKKVKKNPELSSMYVEDKNSTFTADLDAVPTFTTRHKLVLLSFAAAIVAIVVGVVKFGFYIDELSAIFLLLCIVAGIVGGLKINEIAKEFVAGAATMMFAALIIGFSRAITVVMTDASIMDTIIYSMASALKGMPPQLSAIGMFVVQDIFNVIVPSGSGQAAITMPIMAPLAELVGITKQTAVLAYQFGDAFTNILSPTSGYFMAALAMSNISWNKWVKFFLPLFLLWCVIACVFLVIAVQTGYGPF